MRAKAERRGAGAAARNLGWLLGSKGLDAVLGLLYLGLTTRALGIADFGRFSLIIAASQAVITLVAFPTWQIVIQFGVGHLLSGNQGALGRLFRAAALLDCLAACVGALIVALIIGLFGSWLGIRPEIKGFVIAFALVLLLTLRSTPLGMLRLRDDYAGAARADSVAPVMRMIGSALAWAFWPTISGFLSAWALAEIATSAAYWWSVGRKGDLNMLFAARVNMKTVAAENPHFLRFAFSSNANVALNLSERQLPLLLVGAVAGPAVAGAYGLASQLAMALSKLAQMLTRAAFPELVHAIRGASSRDIGRMLVKILLASSASALAILLLVVVIGRPVLGLVGGPPYVSAFPVLVWLALAGCLDLAMVGFEPILMALHRAGTAFLIRALSAVVMVAALTVLTPRLGAIGAAMSLLASTVLTDILLAIVTYYAVTRVKSESPGHGIDRVQMEAEPL